MVPAPALDTWRSASGSGPGGLGGDEAGDWFIRPDDVIICKDPRGNDWQLGSGAYGSVRRPPLMAGAAHSTQRQAVVSKPRPSACSSASGSLAAAHRSGAPHRRRRTRLYEDPDENQGEPLEAHAGSRGRRGRLPSGTLPYPNAAAQVYKGMLQGSTPVAVKFVRGHSPKEQARFRNEVGILKSLRHTNIVQARAAPPPRCLRAHRRARCCPRCCRSALARAAARAVAQRPGTLVKMQGRASRAVALCSGTTQHGAGAHLKAPGALRAAAAVCAPTQPAACARAHVYAQRRAASQLQACHAPAGLQPQACRAPAGPSPRAPRPTAGPRARAVPGRKPQPGADHAGDRVPAARRPVARAVQGLAARLFMVPPVRFLAALPRRPARSTGSSRRHQVGAHVRRSVVFF